jgi:hypothetical protein
MARYDLGSVMAMATKHKEGKTNDPNKTTIHALRWQDERSKKNNKLSKMSLGIGTIMATMQNNETSDNGGESRQ